VADEITFSIVGTGAVNLTGGPSGMTSGPVDVFEVTDITTGASFSLHDSFTASAGGAHSIALHPTYVAFFAPGGAGSVDITNAVTGTMLDNSELTAVYPDSTGSFSGEFDVTSFNPAILTMFGIKGHVAPVGSVGLTFGHDAVTGSSISGIIGGGSTTVLTIKTAVPEPDTWFLLLFGLGTIVAFCRARRWS
jgi:hypothetical protein